MTYTWDKIVQKTSQKQKNYQYQQRQLEGPE